MLHPTINDLASVSPLSTSIPGYNDTAHEKGPTSASDLPAPSTALNRRSTRKKAEVVIPKRTIGLGPREDIIDISLSDDGEVVEIEKKHVSTPITPHSAPTIIPHHATTDHAIPPPSTPNPEGLPKPQHIRSFGTPHSPITYPQLQSLRPILTTDCVSLFHLSIFCCS